MLLGRQGGNISQCVTCIHVINCKISQRKSQVQLITKNCELLEWGKFPQFPRFLALQGSLGGLYFFSRIHSYVIVFGCIAVLPWVGIEIVPFRALDVFALL